MSARDEKGLLDDIFVLPDGALLHVASGVAVVVNSFDVDEEEPTFAWSVCTPSGCSHRGRADSPEDAVKAAMLAMSPHTIPARPEDK